VPGAAVIPAGALPLRLHAVTTSAVAFSAASEVAMYAEYA